MTETTTATAELQTLADEVTYTSYAPKVIVPTVGRRLYFWPNAEHQAALGVFDATQPCDAGVLYVHNERSVNLLVTGPSGTQLALQHVQLAQENDAYADDTSYAAWMPYQTAQAAKSA